MVSESKCTVIGYKPILIKYCKPMLQYQLIHAITISFMKTQLLCFGKIEGLLKDVLSHSVTEDKCNGKKLNDSSIVGSLMSYLDLIQVFIDSLTPLRITTYLVTILQMV